MRRDIGDCETLGGLGTKERDAARLQSLCCVCVCVGVCVCRCQHSQPFISEKACCFPSWSEPE